MPIFLGIGFETADRQLHAETLPIEPGEPVSFGPWSESRLPKWFYLSGGYLVSLHIGLDEQIASPIPWTVAREAMRLYCRPVQPGEVVRALVTLGPIT